MGSRKDYSKGADVEVIGMPVAEENRCKVLELTGLDEVFDEAELAGVEEDA